MQGFYNLNTRPITQLCKQMSEYDLESGQESEIAGFVSKTYEILNVFMIII